MRGRAPGGGRLTGTVREGEKPSGTENTTEEERRPERIEEMRRTDTKMVREEEKQSGTEKTAEEERQTESEPACSS